MLGFLHESGWASVLTQALPYLAALPATSSLFSSPASASEASPSWALSIQSELGPLLAPSAQVLLPSSPDFATYNERWSETGRPTYAVIITATNENDVSAAVKYANEHDIPFLATTGTHGTWYGLEKFQNGMAIYMRGISHFDLSLDGKSVTFGGGVRGTDVVNNLWAVGKQTVSGACTCVSIAGPALGGGHGFLQGQYGLLTDQIIGARVVLADGEIVTVNEKENADLFWALKGAGHNFGIVTEFQYRVYDTVKPEWAYEFLFFSGDKIEELYEVHNEMMEYQPAEAVQWSVWRIDPEVDPVNVSHQNTGERELTDTEYSPSFPSSSFTTARRKTCLSTLRSSTTLGPTTPSLEPRRM
jgi:FAD/FMN-containing dehydrogenase